MYKRSIFISIAAVAMLGMAHAEDIIVHLVPHTHDDVGWLKTVDGYYSGSDQKYAMAEVHLILDEVVEALLEDPKKKFTYVEMKFFETWWTQ